MKRLIVLLISVAVFATACAQGNVFTLAVGDCFNNPEVAEQIASVEIVSCEVLHDNEVFATFDIADGPFPGRAAIQQQASDGCIERFEPYVGSNFIESALDISFLTPSSDSWESDDREIVCFAFDLDGTEMTASVRATGV